MRALYDSYTESIRLLNERIRELEAEGGNEHRIRPLLQMRRTTYEIRAMIRRYVNEDYINNRDERPQG